MLECSKREEILDSLKGKTCLLKQKQTWTVIRVSSLKSTFETEQTWTVKLLWEKSLRNRSKFRPLKALWQGSIGVVCLPECPFVVLGTITYRNRVFLPMKTLWMGTFLSPIWTGQFCGQLKTGWIWQGFGAERTTSGSEMTEKWLGLGRV